MNKEALEAIADYWAKQAGETASDTAEVLNRMRSLYDASAPMADGGDTPMTAAEEVLSWLLVEKIGVPDDVSYSPDQAQDIITARLLDTQEPTHE